MSNERFEIQAEERDTTRNPRQLRAAGITPATIYAKGVTPRSIQVPSKAFYMAFKAGHKQYTLAGLGINAKVQQLQVHSTHLNVLNIEFMIEA